MSAERERHDIVPDDWLQIVRGEYLEMPGLSLTERQAQRLWCLEPAACRAVLASLTEAGFLRQTNEGEFVRAGTR